MELATLIKSVWSYSPAARVLLITFMAVTLLTHIAGIQQTPFFIWGMYSEKYSQQNEYHYYRVVADGKLVNPFSTMYHPARHLLYRSLQDWEKMHRLEGGDILLDYMENKVPDVSWQEKAWFMAGLNSRDEFMAYPEWFKRYLGRVTGTAPHHISVYRVTVTGSHGAYIEIASVKLFDI